MEYKKRIADAMLSIKLEERGAVLIRGPKWCGKTTTAAQQAASILYLDEPKSKKQNLGMASIDPEKLLAGEKPRLIDEWQLAPVLWDAVRFQVDRKGRGQFILTGSAVPADDSEIIHSGAGRFAWLDMRPMSLFESEDSSGSVSLRELFKAPDGLDGKSDLGLDELSYLICRGGWPKVQGMHDDLMLDSLRDYLDEVVSSDISRTDGIKRDPRKVLSLMRSYARHQGTQTSESMIAADMAGSGESAQTATVTGYLRALEKIFVVEEMSAWRPFLRSKTPIRLSDVRYFVDPAIAAASLVARPRDLVNDLETMGALFKTLCVRDLRVYADAFGGKIFHYRDKNDLECDAVVHLPNGQYGLTEIKLGGDALIEEGAGTLKKLASKIDTSKMPAPAFLMVLTGVGPYAYRRKDGVYVVPVGCLKD